jgi:membrane protein
MFIRRAINSPVGELTRAQRVVRFWIDLAWHCTRALRHDRAGEMAAALTYRTIFSLIPLLVTLLLVFQAFKGLDSVRQDLQPMVYKYMGVDVEYRTDAQAIDPTLPVTPGKPDKKDPAVEPQPVVKADPTLLDDTKAGEKKVEDASQPPAKAVDKQVMLRIDKQLASITDQVANLNFQSIGAIGFVLFIWAAIDLVVTLELSFNRVFNSPGGRPWLRRIPIYWAVITLGPVLVWLSLSVAGRLVGAAEQVPVLGVLVSWASGLFALAASWLLLFLLYKLMPNTTVSVRAALAGSFVAAVLWELGKFGFGLYVNKALPYAKIYGALGLIPLFLFWVYITWIIVLFGLELTYTLQAMKGKRFKYELPTTHAEVPGDPQWIIPIVTQIGQDFTQGKATESRALTDLLSLPEPAVAELCLKLEEAGIIHKVQGGENDGTHYALSLPPDKVRIERLLTVADSLRHASDPSRTQAGWELLRTLASAQRVAAADLTLASLMREPVVTA